MLDIGQIREQLNELTFEGGERQTCLGRISELFPEQGEDHIGPQLEEIKAELQRHGLDLSRGEEDPDELFIVQKLKHGKNDLTGFAEAMQWASKITAIAIVMVVPAVIGFWLDKQFGTGFLLPLGALIGPPLGLWSLFYMTKDRRH